MTNNGSVVVTTSRQGGPSGCRSVRGLVFRTPTSPGAGVSGCRQVSPPAGRSLTPENHLRHQSSYQYTTPTSVALSRPTQLWCSSADCLWEVRGEALLPKPKSLSLVDWPVVLSIDYFGSLSAVCQRAFDWCSVSLCDPVGQRDLVSFCCHWLAGAPERRR